jgi:hypothetical protein
MADAAGRTRIALAHLADAALATDGIAAFVLASNGDWSVYWAGTALSQVPAPTAADYPSVADEAVLVYTDAAGLVARVTILAPVAAVFLADGQTVDPADPTGIIAAWLAILVTPSDTPVTSFVAGYRRP